MPLNVKQLILLNQFSKCSLQGQIWEPSHVLRKHSGTRVSALVDSGPAYPEGAESKLVQLEAQRRDSSLWNELGEDSRL